MDTIETIHVYLDSNDANENNGSYSFNISPPIQLEQDEDCYVHLQSFTSLHNHNNITDTNMSYIFTDNGGVPTTVTLAIDQTQFSSAAGLITAMSNVITSNATASHFTLTLDGLVAVITPTQEGTITFTGALWERLEVTLSKDYTIAIGVQTQISGKSIDVHENFHNLYVSCDEVSTNSRMTSPNGIQNRIGKLQVVNPYGSYNLFRATSPVEEYRTYNSTFSSLTIRMSDDIGRIVEPSKWTMTLCFRKQYKNVVRNRDKTLEAIYAKIQETNKMVRDYRVNFNKEQPQIAENETLRECRDVKIGRLNDNNWWLPK